MDRQTDDFATFVADCEQQLRGTALLLTGDPAQADDLVVAALARTHRRWRRLSTPADALADTRTALVAAALGGTRLSASGGTIGTLDGPDDDRSAVAEAAVDRLDPGDRRWLAALTALGPTARAVVVLRLVEGQDEETVAELLGRSPRVVADALDTAVQTLGDLLEPDPGPDAHPEPVPVAVPSATGPWALQPRADGDPDAAFRRPGTATPPGAVTPPTGAAPGPAAAPAAPGPAGSVPAGPVPAGSVPAADDDPWAIYRRPT
jgi:DNA-directed RNA polymerase specialized sigma24 family protein